VRDVPCAYERIAGSGAARRRSGGSMNGRGNSQQNAQAACVGSVAKTATRMQKRWTQERTRHGCESRPYSWSFECRRPMSCPQGDVSSHFGSGVSHGAVCQQQDQASARRFQALRSCIDVHVVCRLSAARLRWVQQDSTSRRLSCHGMGAPVAKDRIACIADSGTFHCLEDPQDPQGPHVVTSYITST
jgi:hypothetical protein